jgi:hypothetical protein
MDFSPLAAFAVTLALLTEMQIGMVAPTAEDGSSAQ